MSDLIQGKQTNAPGVVLAVPLHGPGGELRGVVGGVLNLADSNFLRELAHSRVGTTGSFCLVSAGTNPRYAMHPDVARVLSPARAIGEACGADHAPAFLEVLTPTQPIVARYLLASNGWEVVAVLPAAEAYAPLVAVRQRTLVIGAITMLIAAAMMWLVMRRLLEPLQRLHRAVRQIGTNPAAVADLPAGRADEIGELAVTFAEVVAQLSEREAALKAAKDRAAESEKRIERSPTMCRTLSRSSTCSSAMSSSTRRMRSGTACRRSRSWGCRCASCGARRNTWPASRTWNKPGPGGQ